MLKEMYPSSDSNNDTLRKSPLTFETNQITNEVSIVGK